MNELIHYTIDGNDRVNFFDRPFQEFGTENGVSNDAVAGYMGKSVYDFLSGGATKEVYRALLARARRGRTLTFPFRCDAPSLRRYLVMTMEPAGEKGVAFLTRLVKTEGRAPVALLDPAAIRSDELLRMCAWCKRVVVDDIYTEVEDAVDRLRLFNRPALPMITHGICDGCYRTVSSA